MKSTEEKKAFALAAIVPYVADRKRISYTSILGQTSCQYLMSDGRKCVVGQFLLEPEKFKDIGKSVENILTEEAGGENLLIPEARGILSMDEWMNLQRIHDNLASFENNNDFVFQISKRHNINLILAKVCAELGLFTYAEMMQAAEEFKKQN